jgi:hypothetical protein
LPRLAQLYGTLRARLLASTLRRLRFAAFEYALRGMWCRWCRAQGAVLSPAQALMADFDFTPIGGGQGTRL